MGSLDWRAWCILIASAVVAVIAPNTQQIFRRYRPTVNDPEPGGHHWMKISWRYKLGWVCVTGAVLGVGCFYDNPYTEFLYWNF